jgi:multiple sugar transport system ATP-binding protein
MTMATRIIVMDKGIVQQVDTPDNVYDQPANTFVARFVGSPPMNLIPVKQAAGSLKASETLSWQHESAPTAEKLIFGVRPEKLVFASEGEGRIPAQVAVVERLGAETVVGCRLLSEDHTGDTRLLEHDLVFVRMPGSPKIRIDDRCSLDYLPEDVVWFDDQTGKRIA